MQNNNNPEQQGDCCDSNCCNDTVPEQKGAWKKKGALLIFSLAILLAGFSVFETAGGNAPLFSGGQNGCGLPSITDFDWMETEEKVALVFLKSTEETANAAWETKLENAYLEMKESGASVSLFILDETNGHYAEVKQACQVTSSPAIIALGRGCQSSVLTDNINTTRLVKAYMLASTPTGSCSKGSSSCCSKPKN